MNANENEFSCLRCGKCCKNLLQLGDDGLVGLMLYRNEINLFEKRDIKPCLAIGKLPNHGSFRIITYQLTKNICPHLKDNSCTIYQERPLMCKGYPLTISGNFMEISFGVVPECTFIKELMEKHQGIHIHEYAISEEMVAEMAGMERLRDYIILKHKKIKRWIYDLKTDKWKLGPCN